MKFLDIIDGLTLLTFEGHFFQTAISREKDFKTEEGTTITTTQQQLRNMKKSTFDF